MLNYFSSNERFGSVVLFLLLLLVLFVNGLFDVIRMIDTWFVYYIKKTRKKNEIYRSRADSKEIGENSISKKKNTKTI